MAWKRERGVMGGVREFSLNLLSWLRTEFTFFVFICVSIFAVCCIVSNMPEALSQAYKLLLIISVWLSHIHYLRSHFIHRNVSSSHFSSCYSCHNIELYFSFFLHNIDDDDDDYHSRDSKTRTDFINSQTNFFRKSFSASSSNTQSFSLSFSLHSHFYFLLLIFVRSCSSCAIKKGIYCYCL